MHYSLQVTQFVILCWAARKIRAQLMNNQNSVVQSSYFFYQRPEYPRDCEEVRNHCSSGTSSGVYLIKPDGYSQAFEIYCENLNSEAWTVLLRRYDERLTFKRSWREFRDGFGFLSKEFWIGNEKLSYLTNQKNYELRINITHADGSSCFVNYDLFRTTDDFGSYKITKLGQFSGNAADCLLVCDCSCQKTCANSSVCLNTCNADITCVCPDGLCLKGEDCVPLVECSTCEVDGTTIPAFQRRIDNVTDFYRNWTSYRNGFGSLEKDFWLGNEQLHYLTKQKVYQLRIDMVTSQDSPLLQTFLDFAVGNESVNYKMTYDLGNHDRTGLYFNTGHSFSTYDRDNDRCSVYNCAVQHHGGWWYGGAPDWCHRCYSSHCSNFQVGSCSTSCTDSNLNGDYTGQNGQNMIWYTNSGGRYCNMKYADMKIRPVT